MLSTKYMFYFMPRPLREMWGASFLSSETFQDSGGESYAQPTGSHLSLPAKDCLDTRGGGGGLGLGGLHCPTCSDTGSLECWAGGGLQRQAKGPGLWGQVSPAKVPPLF